jgi:hypothetical protein
LFMGSAQALHHFFKNLRYSKATRFGGNAALSGLESKIDLHIRVR